MNGRVLAFKLVATALVAWAMLHPFLTPEGRAGVLASLAEFNAWALGAIVAAFLLGIAFYCVTLQRFLEHVAPENRMMRPRAVWLMFMPFYNIIEDFFIIHGVTRSLRREAATNPALKELKGDGAFAGHGWAAGQVLSLVPNRIGEAAAFAALVLWLWHWAFIWRALKRLAQER